MKQLVDKLKAAGVLRINLFGGEPLFYRYFKPLVEYMNEKRFYLSMVTNGRLITKQNATWLADNIDAIAISLHGSEKWHDRIVRRKGAYRDALKKLDFLKARTPHVAANMTVTNSNFTDIPAYIELMSQEHGVTTIALNRCIDQNLPILPIGFTDDDLTLSPTSIVRSLELIDTAVAEHPDISVNYAIHFPFCLTKNPRHIRYIGGCTAGRNYFALNAKGDVSFCSYGLGKLGNIFKEDLLEIWQHHPQLIRFRSSEWLDARCRSCEHLNRCLGGCKVSAHKQFFAMDSLFSKDNHLS